MKRDDSKPSEVYEQLKPTDGIQCAICGRADFLANAEAEGWFVERVNGYNVTKCAKCADVPVA